MNEELNLNAEKLSDEDLDKVAGGNGRQKQWVYQCELCGWDVKSNQFGYSKCVGCGHVQPTYMFPNQQE